ncbi:MAG: prepilin-type N-terminal cleavage/methylation domain-containing protein [candidate division Zixibacteria bacterium]|nr:prepilin-type N-terminal cleavage/methylation domain-containing protein [candidate division Zixibacteria bacterium]
MKPFCIHRASGFTLIEMIVVMVISGILITVALKSVSSIKTSAKIEETRQEMEALGLAIAGNPSVTNNGARADFGYVGDIGALPPNLDALYQNPGGYATWKGPYVANHFAQLTDDYKRDAWGHFYTYSGGLTITSNGGGTMIRQIAPTTSDLLFNSITGTICDIDGTPPGPSYKDSLSVVLTYPNGSGGMRTRIVPVDAAGYFAVDSIPIGNQDLKVVYRPQSDTIPRLVSVTPHSSLTVACRFDHDLWFNSVTSSGSLAFVSGSDTISGPHCENLSFWITNTGGSTASISSVTVSWSGVTAYYGTIVWGSTTIFSLGGSPRGVSGATYTLSPSQTLAAGASVRISVNDFRKSNNAGGGNMVGVGSVPITVRFSNGSTMTFTTDPGC